MGKLQNHQRGGINPRPPSERISELLVMVGCVIALTGLTPPVNLKLVCLGMGVSLAMAGAPAIARWFGRFL